MPAQVSYPRNKRMMVGGTHYLVRGHCMEAIIHLKPLELTDRRQSSRAVHSYLRELILNGSFPPGAVLSQLELSKALGVSRTPLREAFRMLQEEGLIEAEPNLRARVSLCGHDDLATVYASRIVLESLGIALTASTFSQEQIVAAEEALEQMHVASEQNNFAEWQKAHRTFHGILCSHAGQDISRIIQTLIERAERYFYIYRPQNDRIWWSYASEMEHRQLLQACMQHNGDEAVQLIAQHLGKFANAVLAELAPIRHVETIQTALQLVENRCEPAKDIE
jgi:DNA-binding GntR family transcriptional regulator